MSGSETAIAIGTGASAAFIGWQAWLTRQLVRTTQRDIETSRGVLIEAVKTRLDGQMPPVAITVLPDPGRGTYAHPGSIGSPQPYGPPHTLSLPRDIGLRVLTPVNFTVTNPGPDVVRVMSDLRVGAGSTAEAWEVSSPLDAQLAPRESVAHCWWAEMPFEKWAENESSDSPNKATLCVIVNTLLDEGASDRWEITVTGRPFYQDSGTEGRWHVVIQGLSGPPVTAVTSHRQRTYFASRSEDRQLV